MIVPRYWAEERLRHRLRNRQVTVRRFGWSDESQGAAQAHAYQRARDALDRILAGDKLVRREPRVPYNGAEGVPIREEIVDQHGSSVITRNGYGSLCLNSPDVLFADIDLDGLRMPRGTAMSCVALSLISGGVAAAFVQPGVAVIVLCATMVTLPILASLMFWFRTRLAGGREAVVRRRIEQAASQFPDWRLRLYSTPAGFRVMATHQTFVPGSEEVEAFFLALGTDPVYATMCRRQQCFRARISPKPWRVGMAMHIRPRRGAWPVAAEHLPAREAWLQEYAQRSEGFAACRFESEFGINVESDTVAAVRQLHDDYCRAHSGLPIA